MKSIKYVSENEKYKEPVPIDSNGFQIFRWATMKIFYFNKVGKL